MISFVGSVKLFIRTPKKKFSSRQWRIKFLMEILLKFCSVEGKNKYRSENAPISR